MASEPSIALVTLKNFPHHGEVCNDYFLDKSHWPNVVSLLKNPRRLCCGNRGRLVYDILRFFSIISATAALVIALIKDFMNKEDSLMLSTIELVLALIAVSATLLKHSLEWRHVRKNLRKFEIANPETSKKSIKCSKKCLGFFNSSLIAIWFFCCSLLAIGFGVFHLFDDSESDFLKYTKFSTALTLFISWILDSMVAEALSEMTLHWNMDRCALLIHVIKEELYHELRKSGRVNRIEELEKYLNGDKILNVERNHRILVKARENANGLPTGKFTHEKIEMLSTAIYDDKNKNGKTVENNETEESRL